MFSDKTLVMGVADETAFNGLATSPFKVDQWIFEESDYVFYYVK